MTISPINSAASVQAASQPAVSKPTASPASNTPAPAYTVSLSSTAHKTAVVDVDHDGDSH